MSTEPCPEYQSFECDAEDGDWMRVPKVANALVDMWVELSDCGGDDDPRIRLSSVALCISKDTETENFEMDGYVLRMLEPATRTTTIHLPFWFAQSGEPFPNPHDLFLKFRWINDGAAHPRVTRIRQTISPVPSKPPTELPAFEWRGTGAETIPKGRTEIRMRINLYVISPTDTFLFAMQDPRTNEFVNHDIVEWSVRVDGHLTQRVTSPRRKNRNAYEMKMEKPIEVHQPNVVAHFVLDRPADFDLDFLLVPKRMTNIRFSDDTCRNVMPCG